MIKIVFTGGGTGGHVFPLIAVMRECKAILALENTPYEFVFLGAKDDFAPVVFANEQMQSYFIFTGKLRRYFDWRNIVDGFKVPIGFLQSLFWLWAIMPDIVFSKGGFASVPVVFVAWLYRIPVIIHESDVEPGLANRMMALFAKQIIASFPQTRYFSIRKMRVVGNPVRRSIFACTREDALALFGIHFQRKVLLILGGSQGAQRINDFILSTLPNLLTRYETIHQIGEKNFEEVIKEAHQILKKEALPFYHPMPFLHEHELCAAYRAADIVVSRSGSGSIFEIAAHGKPSILIPLPEAAQNHQVWNAYAYGETGAAFVFEEANLTPNLFIEKIDVMMQDPVLTARMTQEAQSFARPEAARDIAKEILQNF